MTFFYERTAGADVRRAADLGLIHAGRTSERVTGGRTLALRDRRRGVHPALVVIAVLVALLAYGWWRS